MQHAASRLAVIVPLFNEGDNVIKLIARLEKTAADCEVLLVDASNQAESIRILQQSVDACRQQNPNRLNLCCIRAPRPGRAQQMNLGAEHSLSSRLLFLHADTRLPDDALGLVERQFERGRCWGRFDVRLDANGLAFRVIEQMMNLRSAISGIATGDQAIFVSRAAFESVGGYAAIPLMEDVALSKGLRKLARPGLVHTPVITSARRWQSRGIVPTILLMWKLRFLYWLGVDAGRLARLYADVR